MSWDVVVSGEGSFIEVVHGAGSLSSYVGGVCEEASEKLLRLFLSRGGRGRKK